MSTTLRTPYRLANKWLVLALVGYCAWLAVLGWLAWTAPDTVVSHPQIEAAPVVIIGRVVPDGAGGWQVRIVERLKPKDPQIWHQLLALQSKDLDLARPAKPAADSSAQPTSLHDVEENQIYVAGIERAQGWQGSGEYLLALFPASDGPAWQIASWPRYPGVFPSLGQTGRIYPATPGVLRQVRTLLR